MKNYKIGFLPYALAAFLIGLVGGFSTVLGPAFVQDLGIDYNNTTWTALAQAISTAACAPVLGRCGDIFGRKKTLLLGLWVFTLGNILTAVANSLPVMLLARFIVGIGTAAMAPVILAYIVSEFPADRVSMGFSVYMLISSASVIFGPGLGSLVIANSGWRRMVFVCVLLCVAVAIICTLLKEKVPGIRKKPEHFDWGGAFWVPTFFGAALCIPSFGQNLGWRSTPFFLVLLGTIVALAGLVMTERRAPNPILPGTFLRRRSFALSILAIFLTQGLMQVNMTVLIIFLNHTQPSLTTLSGLSISVMYLGMSLGALFLGPLADHREPRNVLFGSFAITALGCAVMLLFSERTHAVLFMSSLGILGLGLGGNGTIFMKVALSGLTPAQSGSCTGTYGLFRDLAAPFGVAILLPLFTNGITSRLAFGQGQAAVDSVHTLAIVELFSVLAGTVVLCFLPKIHHGGAQ